MNKVDSRGTKPGDLFDTMDEAAEDFANYINERSVAENREYASYIYARAVWKIEVSTSSTNGTKTTTITIVIETKYTYKKPLRGTKHRCLFPPNWFGLHNQVALLHSHAAYDSAYENDVFSPTDLQTSNLYGIPSYIVTPLGILRKYNPSTGQDVIIYDGAPFDPNHPER